FLTFSVTYVFFKCIDDIRLLLSFPTRRSSDLSSCKAEAYASVLQQWKQRCALEAMAAGNKARADGIDNGADAGVVDGIWITPGRSEEHTSELQSRENLVCRLLLEKKKKKRLLI